MWRDNTALIKWKKRIHTHDFFLDKQTNKLHLLNKMQAVEGSGTQAATTSGGSGNIGVAPDGGRNAYGVTTADNVNPQAPDCYFYYYSNCAKVCVFICSSFSLLPPSLSPSPPSLSCIQPFFTTTSPSLPHSIPPSPSLSLPPSRVVSASSVTARLRWAQKRRVICG